VVLSAVVLDLLQTLRSIQVHVGRYADRPQVASDAQLFLGHGPVSNRADKHIGQLSYWLVITLLHHRGNNLPTTSTQADNDDTQHKTANTPSLRIKYATFVFLITSSQADQFSFFFTVKFRKDLRRKLKLKLPPPVKSVATLAENSFSDRSVTF